MLDTSPRVDKIPLGGVHMQAKVLAFGPLAEILGGRVKSLHPKIYGGILCNRKEEDHLKQIKEYNMPLFDDKEGISEYSFVVGFPDRKNYLRSSISYLIILSVLFILVSILPIIPSGSFFTTYTATIFWINFSFLIGNSRIINFR